jgi:hypothetical protein
MTTTTAPTFEEIVPCETNYTQVVAVCKNNLRTLFTWFAENSKTLLPKDKQRLLDMESKFFEFPIDDDDLIELTNEVFENYYEQPPSKWVHPNEEYNWDLAIFLRVSIVAHYQFMCENENEPEGDPIEEGIFFIERVENIKEQMLDEFM